MSQRFQPCLILSDATPDGCAEIALECNGRFVASTVLIVGDIDWYERLNEWWRAQLQRRC